MIKCKNADSYKAIHPPTCNNGDPCLTCSAKWAQPLYKVRLEFNSSIGAMAREIIRLRAQLLKNNT